MNAYRHSIPARAARLTATVVLSGLSALASAQTVQQHVHGHGHEVMPFDLAKTVHVFKMTDDGGTQQVIVRREPADLEQVRLIQQHLQKEAEDFRAGNFADPSHLHGAAMPGLREMAAGARRMQISYRALPNGGEIRFQARELPLITAIHRWFGAQLSEHGADARTE